MALIELDISEPSKVIAILGFYVVAFGLGSYFIKERLFISDSMLALGVGIAVGPIGADWFSLWHWTADQATRDTITFQIARLAVGIQVLFCGINLPKAYLLKSWQSLAMLIGPVMTAAWLIAGGLIYALVPSLTFLDSLVISACVAPTDPILANAIVKGRFAEEHVPVRVRNILAAESGANDGLGVPFIYLAIYIQDRFAYRWSVGEAVKEWFVAIVLYEILLSVAMGAVIGEAARRTLKFAESRALIDHESFLSYSIGLAFFTLGVVGMIGSDDLLACFIAGNVFTIDDWFRVQTEDHSFQHVIDQLINSAVFIYFGTIIPWSSFTNDELGLTPGKLVAIAVLILLLRRLPATLLTFKLMPDIKSWREAGFAGWFGPIGVSAIYYAELALQKVQPDRTATRELVVPIVYFVILGSVLTHGISIPVLKYPQLVSSGTYSRTNSMAASASFRNLNGRTDTLPKVGPPTVPPPAHLPEGPQPTAAAAEKDANGGGGGGAAGEGKKHITIADGAKVGGGGDAATPTMPSSPRHGQPRRSRDGPPSMEEREGTAEAPEHVDPIVQRENERDRDEGRV